MYTILKYTIDIWQKDEKTRIPTAEVVFETFGEQANRVTDMAQYRESCKDFVEQKIEQNLYKKPILSFFSKYYTKILAHGNTEKNDYFLILAGDEQAFGELSIEVLLIHVNGTELSSALENSFKKIKVAIKKSKKLKLKLNQDIAVEIYPHNEELYDTCVYGHLKTSKPDKVVIGTVAFLLAAALLLFVSDNYLVEKLSFLSKDWLQRVEFGFLMSSILFGIKDILFLKFFSVFTLKVDHLESSVKKTSNSFAEQATAAAMSHQDLASPPITKTHSLSVPK